MDPSGNFLAPRRWGSPKRAAAGFAFAATLFAALPAWADGVAPWDASPKEAKAAEVKFKAGSKLYDKGEFDGAIAAFQESYEIVASPNTTLMIARSYREGGQLKKAVQEFQHAVEVAQNAADKSDKYKPTLDAAKKEFADLNATMAHLEIELINAPEGTKVVIDGDAVDDLSTPAMVMPGTLSVVATAPDGRETKQQVEVNAGTTKKVRLGFARSEDPEMYFDKERAEDEDTEEKAKSPSSGSGMRTVAYVSGGVGIVGLAAFGVFGAMSNSKYKDLQSSCPDNHCTPDRANDIDNGRRFQTIANVGLVIGAVGVATSAVFFILAPSHKEKGAEKHRQKHDAETAVGFGFGSVQVRGRF